MKTLLQLFFILCLSLTSQLLYSQCNAVTGGAGNGITYSTLPACNGTVTGMSAPPTGYVVMTNLETGGVYTVERTGGNGSNYLTARSATSGGTVFGAGNGPLTFTLSTGTVANIVVNGSSGCSATWDGTSTILQYRRVQPNTPNTPIISFNCGANSTILTSSSTAVGGIVPSYQWQGSNDNSSWTSISGATGTTYTITAATSPQYLFYRQRAGYGTCYVFSSSITTLPRGNYTGNVTISSNVTLSGTYNITGDFSISSGVTVSVAQGCVLTINATNITVSGSIDANGAGASGGNGGARGNERDDGSCSYTTQANFGSGGAAGGGTGGGTAGGNGGSGGANCIGCGTLCVGGNDGYFAGGGGGGGGGGGSYGGAGGNGGAGAGGVSWSGGPFGGGGGSAGAAGGTYGNGSDASDVTLGSGGSGGGGGGGGWLTTGNLNRATDGGNGGNGGGGVNLVASNALSFTGSISANGTAGGTGGTGGTNRYDGYNCNSCNISCCGETECRDNDQCGACTYYTLGAEGGAGAAGGGGSGGGIKLQAFGNMTVTGALSAVGGNGGAMGASPSTTNGSCYQNTRAGGAGGGGRIKIVRNPCATNNISPSSSAVTAGNAGAGSNNHSNGFSGNNGTYVNNINHPSYTALTPGTASANQTICAGQTPSDLTSTGVSGGLGAGSYTYQWYVSTTCAAATTGTGSSPAAGWSLISGATSSTLTSAQMGTLNANTCYQLRVRSGECYGWTNSITITVNTAATANAGSAATICTGTTYTLTGSSVGGSATTGAWSIVSSTGTVTTSSGQLSTSAQTSTPNTVTFTPTSGTSGTATLRLTTNDPAGPCNAVTSDVVITVDQNPTTANAGADINLCNATTATLAGNTPTVGTGAWSVIAGSASVTMPASPTSGVTGLSASNPSSTVTLRWTTSNGACPNSTDDVVITNFFPSNGSSAVSVPSNICEGQTALIGLFTGTVGDTFQWQSSPDGTTWSNISGATSSTYTTPALSPTTDNYFRAIVKNGVCASANSTPVQVGVSPIISNNTITASQSICTGAVPDTLRGSLPSGGNGSYGYLWQSSTTSATGPWSTAAGTATSRNYVPGAISANTWYRRRVTSSLCEDFTTSIMITVNAIPTTANAGPNQNICGDVATLAGNAAISGTPVWSVLGGGTASVTTPSSPTSGVTSLDNGDNTFEWAIANGGCVSRDTVVIKSTAIPNDIVSTYASVPKNASSTVTANFECLATNGWTHYINSGTDNTLNTSDDYLVLSLKKNGNNIGTIGDGTMVVRQILTSGYGNGGHKIDSVNAPYINNNVDAWVVFGRYWEVLPTNQPNTDSVMVRFYYDDQDFGDIENRLSTEGWEALQGSNSADKHKQLQYYKIHSGNGFTISPTGGHNGITDVDDPGVSGSDGDIVIYQEQTGNFNPTTPKPLHRFRYQFMYGEFHYAEMPVWSFSGGGGGSGGGGQGPLPVKLIYLRATAINNSYIQLDWATALEIDNKGFSIERSIDGVNFETIGWVDGNGNSTTQINYGFDDKTAQFDVRYYYRLKQEDFDGTSERSYVVTAMLVSELKTAVGEFVPNPTRDNSQIDIFVTAGQEGTVTVFDATGKLIRKEAVKLSKGFNTYRINTEDLSTSVYMVNFRVDDLRITKRLNVIR